MNELAPSTRAIHAGFDFFAKHAGLIVRGIVAAAVAAVLASGFYIVKKEEQGVLTRFGQVVDAEVSPGWHYAIPVAEEAHVRKVKRVVRHQVARATSSGASSSRCSSAWGMTSQGRASWSRPSRPGRSPSTTGRSASRRGRTPGPPTPGSRTSARGGKGSEEGRRSSLWRRPARSG